MKNFFLMAATSVLLFACNDSGESTSVRVDSTDHSATANDGYKASEGDVSYREGKVVVWRNNEWVETNDDVKLENGVVVRKNGEVERDGKVVVLKDGEVVDRTGRFFDRAGNAIENAWDDVKEGVKEGAKDVKEGVKDVFDDDKKDNN